MVFHSDEADNGTRLSVDLPSTGARLLLLAPDRSAIADVFTWKALPAGVSVGRRKDGGPVVGYTLVPTPGLTNQGHFEAERLLELAVVSQGGGGWEAIHDNGSAVHCTTDGRLPTTVDPLASDVFLPSTDQPFTLRALAPHAIPSPPVFFDGGVPTPPFIAIGADPADLFSDSSGVLSLAYANHTLQGRAAERAVRLHWDLGQGPQHAEAILSVAGSGSRGAAKKSLRLRTVNGLPFGGGLPPFDEVMLRADASPGAFLHNLFMEAVAEQGAQLDVQESEVLALRINGEDQGLYRLMPPKNDEWLRTISGGDAVEVIDGPGARALAGGRQAFDRWLRALVRQAPADSLAALMETTSLVDLACFDLWMGRADHDLNTRCWRPADKGGRWRWILFDMDLWAPPHEGTVARMCSESAPASPWLPQLLEHPELHKRVLARFSAWMASAFSHEHASALVDSIHQGHVAALAGDHARWSGSLERPTPEEAHAGVLRHVRERPAHVLDQLAQRTGHPLTELRVAVSPSEAGSVTVEELPVALGVRSIQTFEGVPLRLRASAHAGYRFKGWKDGAPDAERSVDPAEIRAVVALFERIDNDRLP